jgi:hypothetical protein
MYLEQDSQASNPSQLKFGTWILLEVAVYKDQVIYITMQFEIVLFSKKLCGSENGKENWTRLF